MLLIQREEQDAGRIVLLLQGFIVADWANLLERECLGLNRYGRRVALDLSGVILIDRSGLEALGRIGRSGFEIVGCSPLMAGTLEQEGIEVIRQMEDSNKTKVSGKRPETS